MNFLITNNNKTWNNIELIPNKELIESNPNYYFQTFNSSNIANFLFPVYFNCPNPILWQVSSQELSNKSIGFLNYYSMIIPEKPLNIVFPSHQQKLLLAILTAFNVVQNPLFLKWIKRYLSHSDLKATQTLSDNLYELYEANLSPQNQYFNCLHPLLFGILNNKEEYFAYSVIRAYYDFPNLDLEKIINIILNLNFQEIQEILTL